MTKTKAKAATRWVLRGEIREGGSKGLPLWPVIALLAGGVVASELWWFGPPGYAAAVFTAAAAIALIGT